MFNVGTKSYFITLEKNVMCFVLDSNNKINCSEYKVYN